MELDKTTLSWRNIVNLTNRRFEHAVSVVALDDLWQYCNEGYDDQNEIVSESIDGDGKKTYGKRG